MELWQSSGKSAAVVAAELGIRDQTLKTWKQPLCLPPPPSTAQTMQELQAGTAACGVIGTSPSTRGRF